MSFLDQTVELLSQYPGSLIYHFGILFAIEATLGIALGYRQRPAVRRVALAAGGMLAGRLALMGIALLDAQGLVADPGAILPPLERAVDALGVWLLIWALSPLFDKMPQWGDVLAGGGVLVLVALYLFFAVAWHAEVMGTGALLAYNNSSQEVVWEAIQLGLLGAAGTHTLLDRRGDWTLRFGILAILFGAHLVHFGWASPGENVAGWERLGQLIAYPLLTVSAYRLVVGRLLEDATRPAERPPGELIEQIRRLGAIAATLDEGSIVKAAVATIASTTGADTVAMLMLAAEQAEGMEVKLAAVCSEGQLVSRPQKALNLDDLPPLRRAINYKRTVVLRPEGMDDPSRLSLLMRLAPKAGLKVHRKSALLIQPIYHEKHLFGALLAQSAAGVGDWPASNRRLLDLLAAQLAVALAQARNYQRLQSQVAQLGEQLGGAEENAAGQLGQLQTELDEAQRVGRELAGQLEVARQEVLRTRKRAQGLAALLDERAGQIGELAVLTRVNEEQQARIAALQGRLDELAAELENARSVQRAPPVEPDPAKQPLSLLQAESPEWEQTRLVAQELRQPMASISGYTDLLLGESVGAVGELQRLFLQRVKVSAERARELLDELVQAVASHDKPVLLDLKPVNVAEVIANTVLEFSNQIGEKELDVQVNLDDSLPELEMDREGLNQIIRQLLANALQATPPNETVAVEAHYQSDGGDDGRGKGYLFLSVRDLGGGVALAEQPHVFDRHYWSERRLIAGLGENGAELPLVQELVQAQGGRIWIESELNVGSTFSMVLPAAAVQPARES